jgi:V/A-type H+/Na+-transporting ATPase subunit I
MVVRMKRLDVLLYHKERERFLDELKKLGVVHIVEEERVDEAPDVQKLGDVIRRAERIEILLRKTARDSVQSPVSGETVLSPETLLDRFESLEQRIEQCNQETAALRKDIAALKPWGNFDPATVNKLREAGIRVRFFVAEGKEFASIDRAAVVLHEICKSKSTVYFVVIERGEPTVLPQAEEVRLPGMSIDALGKTMSDREGEVADLRREMVALGGHAGFLARFIGELKETFMHERARISMAGHAGGKLMHLQGWLPVKKEQAVVNLLQTFSAWFNIRDARSCDAVPVKIENGPYARLFEPILKIFSLPDYFELDPTPFFAPFFMGFVGLCLGDVGYGSIVMVGSIVGYFKAPRTFKPFAALGMVLGFSAICVGIILNSMFGNTLFGGPGIPEANNPLFPNGCQIAFLSPVEKGKGTVYPAMSFVIFVGIFQVMLAIVLQIFNRIRTLGIRGAAQPFGFLLMIAGGMTLMAQTNFQGLKISDVRFGALEVGRLFTFIPVGVAAVFCFVGVILHMFFNNLDAPLVQRLLDPTKGFLELYFFISGFLGNVLSYLRLFAVGLAGGLLGSSFTYIAFMFIAKDGKPDFGSPLIVVTGLVLLFGHSLNLGLSLIGSFVHPLRLTFVEFYSNLGFKGGGRIFRPFAAIPDARHPPQEA